MSSNTTRSARRIRANRLGDRIVDAVPADQHAKLPGGEPGDMLAVLDRSQHPLPARAPARHWLDPAGHALRTRLSCRNRLAPPGRRELSRGVAGFDRPVPAVLTSTCTGTLHTESIRTA